MPCLIICSKDLSSTEITRIVVKEIYIAPAIITYYLEVSFNIGEEEHILEIQREYDNFIAFLELLKNDATLQEIIVPQNPYRPDIDKLEAYNNENAGQLMGKKKQRLFTAKFARKHSEEQGMAMISMNALLHRLIQNEELRKSIAIKVFFLGYDFKRIDFTHWNLKHRITGPRASPNFTAKIYGVVFDKEDIWYKIAVVEKNQVIHTVYRQYFELEFLHDHLSDHLLERAPLPSCFPQDVFNTYHRLINESKARLVKENSHVTNIYAWLRQHSVTRTTEIEQTLDVHLRALNKYLYLLTFPQSKDNVFFHFFDVKNSENNETDVIDTLRAATIQVGYQLVEFERKELFNISIYSPENILISSIRVVYDDFVLLHMVLSSKEYRVPPLPDPLPLWMLQIWRTAKDVHNVTNDPDFIQYFGRDVKKLAGQLQEFLDALRNNDEICLDPALQSFLALIKYEDTSDYLYSLPKGEVRSTPTEELLITDSQGDQIFVSVECRSGKERYHVRAGPDNKQTFHTYNQLKRLHERICGKWYYKGCEFPEFPPEGSDPIYIQDYFKALFRDCILAGDDDLLFSLRLSEKEPASVPSEPSHEYLAIRNISKQDEIGDIRRGVENVDWQGALIHATVTCARFLNDKLFMTISVTTNVVGNFVIQRHFGHFEELFAKLSSSMKYKIDGFELPQLPNLSELYDMMELLYEISNFYGGVDTQTRRDEEEEIQKALKKKLSEIKIEYNTFLSFLLDDFILSDDCDVFQFLELQYDDVYPEDELIERFEEVYIENVKLSEATEMLRKGTRIMSKAALQVV